MPFEFMSTEQIDWRLQGDFTFHPAHSSVSGNLREGQWTDDTHMTVCVIESLLERKSVDGGHIASKFLAWFQGGDLRGIGTTTRDAMVKMAAGVLWTGSGRQGEMAAGNGAAMRIAPIGLWHARNRASLMSGVRAATISTHNCEEAVQGAAAVAFAIAKAAADELDVATIVAETCDFLGPCTMAERLRLAESLRHADWRSALARLGTGGYVLETVASAFYCLLASPLNFSKGVEMAVRAGGDTDTTGAVTGALIGAHVGLAGIPDPWLERVEAGPRLAELARQLCGLVYS